MKKIIVLLTLSLTGCQSNIGQTCEKFGLTTQYVDVVAIDHEVLDKAYTKTTFRCIPKTKYKSGK